MEFPDGVRDADPLLVAGIDEAETSIDGSNRVRVSALMGK